MKKMIRTLCFALSLVAASASASSPSACDVVGSYISIHPIPDLGLTTDLDQLQLHADGTAWYYQSILLQDPISTGSSTPLIGTWQFNKGIVIVTLIYTDVSPITAGGCCDLTPLQYDRSTQSYRVVDKNTLETIRSVIQVFPLTADTNTVLTGQGTVIQDVTDVFQYIKIPVVTSDVL